MSKLKLVIPIICLVLCSVAFAEPADQVTVPLSDPTRPVMLKASVLNGGITVKGYDGKEVLVEARSREEHSSRTSGMKRIPMTSTGLTVEQDNNEVRVGVETINRPVDLVITTPRRTSVILRSTNDGDIVVSGIDGELDIDNVNGGVTLKNVSGSAVAHALNGEIHACFDRVTPGKPMAFSSLNGDIDVTFPADLKANVSLNSERGEVYSDFDVQMQSQAPKQVVEGDGQGRGKYRVRVEKTVRGTINGGGPEIQFKNFNGSIYIRKAGAAKQ